MINNKQQGFALLESVLILVIAVMIGGTGFYVFKARNNTNNNYANATTSGNSQVAATKKIDKKTTPTTTAETSTPSATTSTPPAPTSKATTFTAANCTGDITVYVSNKAGAEASYNPPASWKVIKTYAYGEAISAYCKIGNSSNAPDYVLANDAYIKSSDLSPTKP